MTQEKVVFTAAIVAMLAIVIGMFGGIFFESMKVLVIGFAVWAIGLVVILSLTLFNHLF